MFPVAMAVSWSVTNLFVSVLENLNLGQTTRHAQVSWMIDWCLVPTLAVFQLYIGINKFYINLSAQVGIYDKYLENTYVSWRFLFNCNYSRKHFIWLCRCWWFHQTFYNVNSLSDLFTNVADDTILKSLKEFNLYTQI